MNTIKRGLKRKQTEQDDDYQNGINQFQAAVRKRESIRIKLQINSNPGILEKELRNKIQVEESICRGTAKFIEASHNQPQAIEAAKNLTLGNLRVDMLRFELNKLRRGRGSPMNKKGKPSYAAVSLSDVRIPLVWRPGGNHDQGDTRKFAVFCIARVGAQIYDTALISPVDRHLTDVSFSDALQFNRMPPYFELKLEVYSHMLEDNHKYNNPRKIAKSIGRAVGRTLAKSLKDTNHSKDSSDGGTAPPEREVKGPKFSLIATATLRLEDAGDEVTSHELYLEDRENERTPQLFGQFCCRLAVQPDCREEAVLVGGLGVRFPENEIAGWQEGWWARLMDWKLCLWTGVELYQAARSPVRQVRVDQDTKIRDHDEETFSIENIGEEPAEFKCVDKENKVMWLAHLYQHACDHRRWRQAAQTKMEILSPDCKPISASRSINRTRSKLFLLYNETKI